MTNKKTTTPRNELEAWFKETFDTKKLTDMTTEMKKTTSSILSSIGSKSGVVTRQEFDVQRKLLLQVAKKLEIIEAKLAGKKPTAKKVAKKVASKKK